MLLFSCEYIAARFRDYYDIRTIYKTNNENNNINNLVNIFQEINESPNAEYEHIGKKTYQKYSVPYTLQIIFTFTENNNIKEIIFNECNIIIENNQTNLLNSDEIRVSPNRYSYKTKISSFGGRNTDEIKLFQEEKKIIIDESEDIFIERYYLNFRNLPIETSMKNISIEYNISVLFKDGKTIEVENKAAYSQEIEERHLYSPIWNRK
jgi:hypothetical protein